MQAFRRVKIDWRKKALAFRFFDAVPGGQLLYYLTQRYVTRTLPRNLTTYGKWQFEHAAAFRRFYGHDLSGARLFEFGVGLDLHSSFVQWCYGVEDQTAFDISRLVRLDAVNRVIRFLRENPPPGCLRVPQVELTDPLEPALQRLYGIRYRAPADVRNTGIAGGSIDLVCTTSVLEHIPRDVLLDVLRECARLCSPQAVMSHVIDYTDHYAHSDGAISIYNFLRFSDAEWARFNPAIHYQNRLRHFEYGELFRGAGFIAVSEKATVPEDGATVLAGVPLAAPFSDMTQEQLLPRTAHWILQKAE